MLEKMTDLLDIMQNAIHAGLAGTDYSDRILGYQSGNFQTQMENRRFIDAGVLNQIILFTMALMASKSAMGLIVAPRRPDLAVSCRAPVLERPTC